MNQPPSNQDFQPKDVDHVIGQYGKPLRAEYRKTLSDRLRDERHRYETIQKERREPRQREGGERER